MEVADSNTTLPQMDYARLQHRALVLSEQLQYKRNRGCRRTLKKAKALLGDFDEWFLVVFLGSWGAAVILDGSGILKKNRGLNFSSGPRFAIFQFFFVSNQKGHP